MLFPANFNLHQVLASTNLPRAATQAKKAAVDAHVNKAAFVRLLRLML
jgi:hypothetical protein